MNAVLSAPPDTSPATTTATAMDAALAPVQEVIRQLLVPQVAKIDTDAHYPHDVMKALGQAGAFDILGDRGQTMGIGHGDRRTDDLEIARLALHVAHELAVDLQAVHRHLPKAFEVLHAAAEVVASVAPLCWALAYPVML